MQWSKLKSRVESRLCPELRGRVSFHATSYRGSHDGVEKVWITLDGKPIARFGHYDRQFAEAAAFDDGASWAELRARLDDEGRFGADQAGAALRAYLDQFSADFGE